MFFFASVNNVINAREFCGKTTTVIWSVIPYNLALITYNEFFIIILQQLTTFKITWSFTRFAQVTNSSILCNTIFADCFLKPLLQHMLSLTESGTPQQHSALK